MVKCVCGGDLGEEFQWQCLKPTDKHGGGSIMVRGLVSGTSMGKLKRLEGKVDTEAYYCILRHQMEFHHYETLRWPAVFHFYARQCICFIFMQDNAFVHTAKTNLQFLERNNFDLLDHPPQLPDLNLLENIWWAIEQVLLDIPFPPMLVICLRKLNKFGTSIPLIDYLNT